VAGNVAHPVFDKTPYPPQQLGEIVTQAVDQVEVQVQRGDHKYHEQFEYVRQFPFVHWYLDLGNRLFQCTVCK